MTFQEMVMLVAFSISPLGAGDSVGDVVAECVGIVRASGLPNETSDMFTTFEAPTWDDAQRVIGACIDHVAQRAPRVSLVVKLDHRPDQPTGRLGSKRRRVDDVLARQPGGSAAPAG